MSQDNTAAPAEAQVDSLEAQVQEVEQSIDGTNSEATETEETVEVEAKDSPKEEIKAQIQEMKKKLKLKVDGREIEEEIDLNNEEYLREMLQKGKSADSKFQKASQIEKQMNQLIKLFKENPEEALLKMGHDPDKLMEQRIERRIKEMEMSPEQKKLAEMERQLAEKESKLKQIEQERHEAEKARMQEEFSRKLDTEITEALSTSKLPKSPYVLNRLANTMLDAMKMGYEDVSAKDILPIIEKQINTEIQEMFSAMPEEVIEAMLGQNVTEKLRKHRLSKMKKAPETASSVKATGKSEEKAKTVEKEAKKIDAREFFKNFGNY
jgi:hypothetical protein